MSTGERRRDLDGLRGIAVLLVVAAHAGLIPGGQFHGSAGVILFFVLSGYLITGLLLAEWNTSDRVDLVAFYARRAARLLPALLFVLVFFGFLVGGAGWFLRDALLAGFYVSNIVSMMGGDLGMLGHTWSLAIEEQFYLLWPLVVVALAARRRWLLVATVVLLLASVGARLTADTFEVVKFGTHTNAYALLAGCLLAMVGLRVGRSVAAGALVVLVAVPFMSIAWFAPATTLVAVAGVVLIAGADRLPLLRARWLGYLGRVSYGWYLWHLPLMYVGWDAYPLQRPLMALLALGVAVVSFRFVEEPIRQGVGRRLAHRTEVRRPVVSGVYVSA